MERDLLVEAIMTHLHAAAAFRHRFATGTAAIARQALRQFQSTRLAHTHADLLASPRFGKAAQFFLTDLYGPDTNASRYDEAQRAMPVATRLLPKAGLETLSDAWKLDAISESLDAAMIDALGGKVHALTPASYAAAYRTIGRAGDRAQQIDLIGAIAASLERFGQQRFALATLRMMREPARLAGFADLQGFLERGLEALHCMGKVAPFIETVASRERALMQALLAGDKTVLGKPP